MEPKKLARNFVEEFKNYTDDEKSHCLTALADYMCSNFEENLCIYIEDDEFSDAFSISLKKSRILFCWNDSI